MENNKQVACTILHQLGGNRFIAMTGAKNFGAMPYGCSFKIGKNSMGVTHVRIKLNSLDTYDMEFIRVHGTKITTKSEAKGIYNDMLQDTFTSHTGLYTSL